MPIIEQNETAYYERYGGSLTNIANQIGLSDIENYEIEKDIIITQDKSTVSVPDDIRLLLVLGLGDGSDLRKLLENVSNDTSILVYEPDRIRFLLVCSCFDISEIICNERIHIAFGEGNLKELFSNGLNSYVGVLNINHIYFQAMPGYMERYPGLKERIIDAVKEILSARVADYVTGITYSRTTYKNQLYALSTIHFNTLLGEFIRRIPNKDIPVILVGAGPSLKKNAAELKKVKGNALIIACTRAMSTLEENGSTADLVMMVDMEEGHDFCTHDVDRQYRLLFHSQSAADIQKEYIGHGIYFGFQEKLFPIKGLANEINDLSTGGSVVTCIFSCMLKAGFKKFILVGEDLAFSEDGLSHSGNFQEHTQERIFEVEGISGNMVKTRADWQVFRAFFEQEIKSHEDIEVIDATEGGALIHGSKVMTLKEAVAGLEETVYPIKEIIEHLPVGFPGDLEEINAFYDLTLKQCSNMLYFLNEAILWNDRIKKMELQGTDNILQNNIKKYEELYQYIVDEKNADALKTYAADIIFLYTDRAQYLLGQEHYLDRLELEKDFFQKMLKADEELIAYIQQLRNSFNSRIKDTILQNNENAYRMRYGLSLCERVIRTGVSVEDIEDFSIPATDGYVDPENNNSIHGTLLYLIFGFGNGEEIKKLLESTADNAQIMVYDPDEISFLRLTAKKDISDIIMSEKVSIVIGKNGDLNSAIEKVLGYGNLEYKRIMYHSGDKEKDDTEYDNFITSIQRRETYLRRSNYSWEYLGENLCVNELHALSQIKDNYLLSDLFNSIPNKEIPVILVAAGPSLRKNAQYLNKAYDKAIIVAVAHAWPILEEMGIKIHFIARHDGMQGKDTGFLKADKLRAQRMLLAASSGYEIQEEYNGKCYYYGFSDEIFRDDYLKNNYLSDNRGGSIATDVFELFAAAGFKNIILVGQDLAYGADGESHASESNSNEHTDTNLLETEDINGERIRTRDDWLMFLGFYEKLISEHPELNIIDATEGGARIRGTRIMPLSDAIEDLCMAEYPIDKWIEATKTAAELYGSDIGSRSLIKMKKDTAIIKQLLREILILSDKICVRLHMDLNDDSEFADDCEKYDLLYHKILDEEESSLLCYYAQAEIQDYVREALYTDGNTLIKIEKEKSLFRQMQGKCIDLENLLDKLVKKADTGLLKEDKEDVDELIEKVRDFYNGDQVDLGELYEAMWDYMRLPMEYRKGNSNKLCKEMLTMIVRNPSKHLYFMLTSALELTENGDIFQHLLYFCIEDEHLTKENLHFIYYQMIRYRFLHPDVNTEENNRLLDDLYEKMYQSYREELKDCFVRIPKEERDKDFVIVLATQVLAINHGPTKTLCDRCYVLEEYLGKKVYIINTAEMMSFYGEINWFGETRPNYFDDYLNIEYIEYKGRKFAFYQCPEEMPQTSVVKQILQLIIDTKPWCVIAIDGACITADMCSEIVPTLTVNLSNQRAITRTTFQVLTQKCNKEDVSWLEKHGYSQEHFIEGLFTFAFKEQNMSLTRRNLGLPEDKVVCVIISSRLDSEITLEFLDMINKLAEKDIYTVFVGKYNKYDEIYARYPLLKEHLIGLGYQKDTLAVDECCDIYINPTRSGGGTSAAEAMYKGLPVVTTDYGDIAIAAGEEFIVADYNEMYDEVIRLSEDKAYYSEKSQRARQRAERLTDSKGEFVRIMQEMESRKLFV